jgi:aryl-alcohol dehydrogenase-like predicted oxidoreductase
MCYCVVAKIDALQAEYSAFETLHESDGLIDTARELGVAYVAYGPLGHGWLVDDFQYNSPDDFAPGDFRRSGTSLFPCTYNRMLMYILCRSAEIPRRKLLPQ